ncbi:Insulin-degrading enzyme [Mycena kentingensis (nom. inval.)]|nr:Insulin-degrading enzyme [Mycena kentingensis (nom. inval.)]
MSSLVDWQRVDPPDAPPYSVFTKSIQKSQQDSRDYRLIRLENGLEAMLVHDGKADKAAAALDVGVGHLQDPDDMPGLAHFCEHLLFMGTEQFPKENEYAEFLAKNNGHSNAYTSTSNTNYRFTVATTALPGALERFSGFFHSPLFSPSCTSRELSAVDSEHKKNYQSDVWRIFQVEKHLSVEGHPWRKFGTGSRKALSAAARKLKAEGRLEGGGGLSASIVSPALSLSSVSSEPEADGGAVGREIRRRLIEWWTSNYCASHMRLCVIGTESLDELAALVSRLFSPILNRHGVSYPKMTTSPIGPEQKATFVAIQGIKRFRKLEIVYPVEWLPPNWRHKPLSFISHFVGHEGPRSLHSYLKRKGYITKLVCAGSNMARGYSAFEIRLKLTQDGVKNYRQVTLVVFKYLSLLRSSEFELFHHEEMVTLSEIEFRFEEEKSRTEKYAMSVAEMMPRPVPRELVLCASALTWPWEDDVGKTKVREYLDVFLRPQNSRVFLRAKGDELVELFPDAVWEQEPWYGTKHYVEKFEPAFLEQAQAPNDISELYLPGPNPFIPTNVEVIKRDVLEPSKRPFNIRETPVSSLWHKQDDRFWVPKAFALMNLLSPVNDRSPRATLLTRLYADIVNDSLTESSYDASLGMLEYTFKPKYHGLYIKVKGYSDKLSVLVQHVLERIKNIVVDQKRLDIFLENAKREYEDFWLRRPDALSDILAGHVVSHASSLPQMRLKELPTVTAEELQKYIQRVLSEAYLRIFVAGNISKDDAIRLAEMAEESLQPTKVPPVELNRRALIIPKSSNHTYVADIPNPDQPNSALTYYVHVGSAFDQHRRVTLVLLDAILHEPTFNVLRTKEQLGYIVQSTTWLLAGGTELGFNIHVQSEKMPGYLEDRVEAFLDGMKTMIEEMTPETFEEHKESLRKRWTEVDKNLAAEVSRHASHVLSGHFDFLRRYTNAAHIGSVTKEDVLKMFLEYVHPSSPTRAKLSIHIKSTKPRQPRVSPAAADAFSALIHSKAFPGVTDDAVSSAPNGDEPHELTDYRKYWEGMLGGIPDAALLLQEPLLQIIATHPVPGEGADPPRPGVTYISDLEAFRAGLEVSADPGLFVHWDDLS